MLIYALKKKQRRELKGVFYLVARTGHSEEVTFECRHKKVRKQAMQLSHRRTFQVEQQRPRA